MIIAIRCTLVLFTSLLALGCHTMQPRYLASPEPIRAEGEFIHTPSGMLFPVAAAGLQRNTIRRYDEKGLDVSASYESTASPTGIIATVYVYPAPSIASIGTPSYIVESQRAMLAQSKYEAHKQDILKVHPNAVLVEEREITLLHGATGSKGMMATFEFNDMLAGQYQSLRSSLYLFCYVHDKWIVKYRFTYPKDFDAGGTIEQFMQSVPWTATNSR